MVKRKQRQPNTLIYAVTHIPLRESNQVKLAALNAVADVYLKLCQAYTLYFCQDAEPHLPSELSATLATGGDDATSRYFVLN